MAAPLADASVAVGDGGASDSGAVAAPADADAMAARVVALVDATDAEGLFALFTAPMKEALPVAKVLAFMRGIVASKGKLGAIEALTPGRHDRAGSFRVHAKEGDWDLRVTIDAQGLLTGLKMTEAAPPDPPVVKSELAIALPFRGAWSVFWGGDKLEDNLHVTQPSQRRAADLVVRGADGKTHKGEGKKNEDYLAWDQEVLAVADGKVAYVTDGVPENEPGTLNPLFALGNAVVIEHGAKLYSFYAHLRPGSLKVKAGATVKQGAVLGRCGNSGNSSEPHLHFHLQDGPLVWKSWGVEAVFPSVALTRGGATSNATGYTFLRGDVIAPPKK